MEVTQVSPAVLAFLAVKVPKVIVETPVAQVTPVLAEVVIKVKRESPDHLLHTLAQPWLKHKATTLTLHYRFPALLVKRVPWEVKVNLVKSVIQVPQAWLDPQA